MPAAAATHVRMVYLARLREAFGHADETLELPAGVADVAGLLEHLHQRGGAWAVELAPGRAVRVAVDHAVATPATPLAGATEIALFPPVTGG